MRQIKIISGMDNYIQFLNAVRPYYEIKNGIEVKSMMGEKLIAILCPDGTCIGKNVDDLITVGTLVEVRAGTAEMADDVANKFITLGFAEDVV